VRIKSLAFKQSNFHYPEKPIAAYWKTYSRQPQGARINEKIYAAQVLVIDENGESQGVKDKWEAINLAKAKGLDLVEIAPSANPPVCKIADYGKYKYELEKKSQKDKSKNKAGEVKEIRLSPRTDEHDLNTKIEQAKKFIAKGYKIRVTIKMKGRENIYQDRAIAQINKVKEMLGLDFEQRPVRLGSRFSAMLVKTKVSTSKESGRLEPKNAEDQN